MRKQILISILLLLIPCAAWAWMPIALGGGEDVAAASCDTMRDAESDAQNYTWDHGKSDARIECATQFIVNGTEDKGAGSGNYTVCAIGLYLSPAVQGAGSLTMTAAIYDDNTGVPGSQVGTASDSISVSSLSSGENEVIFENVDADITDAGTYWVNLIMSGWDGTNYVVWYGTSSSGTEDVDIKGSGSWSDLTSARTMKFKLYTE